MNAPELEGAVWRKSSRSDNNGGACVEIANLGDAVAMRDSKDPTGPAFVWPRSAFAEFVEGMKAGEFDLNE